MKADGGERKRRRGKAEPDDGPHRVYPPSVRFAGASRNGALPYVAENRRGLAQSGWLENGDAFAEWQEASWRANAGVGVVMDTLFGPVVVAGS